MRGRIALAALVLAASAPAWAADAGIVKRLQGSVTLQRAGQPVPVTAGTPVQVGDRIATGADGAVGLTMADDTLVTVGPSSTLVISDYRFDSTTHEGSFVARLIKGTLHFVTGLIARTQPQNVKVETRNAVMGVRGTEFIVDARQEATP